MCASVLTVQQRSLLFACWEPRSVYSGSPHPDLIIHGCQESDSVPFLKISFYLELTRTQRKVWKPHIVMQSCSCKAKEVCIVNNRQVIVLHTQHSPSHCCGIQQSSSSFSLGNTWASPDTTSQRERRLQETWIPFRSSLFQFHLLSYNLFCFFKLLLFIQNGVNQIFLRSNPLSGLKTASTVS